MTFFRTPNHGPMNAVRFKNQNANNTYMILGGSSAWPNDINSHAENHDDFIVPAIPVGTVDITEKFMAVKATVLWGIIDEEGTIEYRDIEGNPTLFGTLSTDADVIAEQSPFVIIQATAYGHQIPVTSFRKMAVATGLVPATGHTNDTFLLAANVQSWGVIESIQYRRPQFVTNLSNFAYKITDVMEFIT